MTRRMIALAGAAAAGPLITGPALAHVTGDMGSLHDGLVHPFAGLDHLLAMVAVGLLAGLRGGRMLYVLPATFVIFLLIGALGGLHAPGSPMVEMAVAGSVVIFGLAVAMPSMLPSWLAVTLTAVFALLHGYAHGSEAPAAQAAGFIAGMAASTLVLHVLGVVLVWQAWTHRVARALGAAMAAAGIALLVPLLS